MPVDDRTTLFSDNGSGHVSRLFGEYLQLVDIIKSEIDKDPGSIEITNFAAGVGQPHAQVLRSMFLSEVIFKTVAERQIPGVGGLFQIYLFNANGIFPVPYERWIDIGDREGTYVRMTFDQEGRWVQQHLPTGKTVTLGLPYQDVGLLDHTPEDLRFELAAQLTSGDPGVEKKRNPLKLFRPIEDQWVIRTPE